MRIQNLYNYKLEKCDTGCGKTNSVLCFKYHNELEKRRDPMRPKDSNKFTYISDLCANKNNCAIGDKVKIYLENHWNIVA